MRRLLEGRLLGLVLIEGLLLEVGVLLDFGKLFAKGGLGLLLEGPVDRRVDRETSLRNRFIAEQIDHLLPDLFVNESRFTGDVGFRRDFDLGFLQPDTGIGFNVSLGRHPSEDVVPPLFGSFGEAARRAVVGIRNRRGKGCGFHDGEVRGIFPEIALGSGGDAVVTAAEVNAIDVELENALLAADAFLNALGEEDFGEFPAHGPVLQLKGLAGKLLGDGRGALIEAFRPHAVVDGPEDADVIDPVVLVEAAVLGGEEGVHKMLRDIVERDGPPVLHEDPPELTAVSVENAARHFHFLQLREIEGLGKVVAGLQVKESAGDPHDRDNEAEDEEEAEELNPESEPLPLFGSLLLPLPEGWQVDHGPRGGGAIAATGADRVKVDVFEVVGHGRYWKQGSDRLGCGSCA